jgi:anti-anti-sigma factor
MISPQPASHSDRPAPVVPTSDGLASASRRQDGDVLIVTFRGEIDASNAAEVGRELTGISNRTVVLVVDLAQVGHLDSTGIALLYELHARLARRGQSLVVVAPTGGAARRVLELTAFDTWAAVADDVDAAVAAAQSTGAGDPPPQGDPR